MTFQVEDDFSEQDALLYQYLTLANQKKRLEDKQNKIKKELMDYAAEHADEEDSMGHLIVGGALLDVAGQSFRGFTRQRRVAQSFDETKAYEVLGSLGISEHDFTEMTRIVSQDKIARLAAEDRITVDDVDKMFTYSETWAFVPTKA